MAIDVRLTESGADIAFRGWDAVWAFRCRLRIPWGQIRSARVVSAAEARRRLRWRLLGTGLPGVVAAGTFSVRDAPGDRELWAVYRDTEVLEIETSVQKFRRVVLQHPERARLALEISERVGS